MFAFGCLKLAAISLRAAPVSLRITHPCFIYQLWQMRRLLRGSLAPENSGFEPFVHVFGTIPSFRIDQSRITELYIISTHKLPLILLIYLILANTD